MLDVGGNYSSAFSVYMKSLSTIIIFGFCYFSISSSCNDKKGLSDRANKIFLDTSKWTILLNIENPFGRKHSETPLSNQEASETIGLLTIAVEKEFHSKLQLENYKIQLMPLENSNGQREVLVNCFCHGDYENWRKTIVDTRDGGSCFFKVIINLGDKTNSLFMVNSKA
jgi:hypothetical protein